MVVEWTVCAEADEGDAEQAACPAGRRNHAGGRYDLQARTRERAEVDVDPRSGPGMFAWSAVSRRPGGRKERLVGLDLAAVFQGQVTGPVPPGREFPDERLHPGQQAISLGQQGDRGAQALPSAGHLHPDPAADVGKRDVDLGERGCLGELMSRPPPAR